jgi:hypothetical protein
MRQPEGLTYTHIGDVKGLVTNVDRIDLKENFALRAMNVRMKTPGLVFSKDDGTQHVFDTYPSGITIVDFYPLFLTKENTEYIILLGLDSANNVRIYVRKADSSGSWDELTKLVKVNLSLTPGVGTFAAAFYTTPPNEPKDILNNVLTLGTNELRHYIAVNINRSTADNISAAYVVSSTPLTIVTEVYLGSDGLGWQQDDTVYLYRTQGVFDIDDRSLAQFYQQGPTPHVRWLEITGQNKVNLLLGSSTVPAVMRTPVKIQKAAVTAIASPTTASPTVYWSPTQFGIRKRPTLLFRLPDSKYANNESYLSTQFFTHDIGSLIQYYQQSTETRWYISRAQLIPHFKSVGTAGKPKYPTDTLQPYITEIGEGIRVVASSINVVTPGERWHTRLYITAIYRGVEEDSVYQQSDPFFQMFVSGSGSSSPDGFPQVSLELGIDMARINKSIHGFRVYVAAVEDENIGGNLVNWFEDADEYVQVAEILFSAPVWQRFAGSKYTYRTFLQITKETYENARASGAITLLASLRHAPVTKRSYLTPPFMVKLDRSQGALVIAVQDDHTLRFSTYGGAGAHQDDNFPDVFTNISGERQRIPLFGRGPILGLGVLPGYVVVFRGSGELEVYDPVSGQLTTHVSDVVAPNSIHAHPNGLSWMGRSGVFLLPTSGAEIRDISFDLKNLFDGSLKLDKPNESIPFITDANRILTRAGYDEVYQESWFQVVTRKEDNSGDEVVQYRYAWTTGTWTQRVLNIGSGSDQVRAYRPSASKSFFLAYAGGILRYPLRSGNTRHEDDVNFDGTSNGKGFAADVFLNLGSLYTLSGTSNLWEILLQWAGESVDGVGYFEMQLYLDFKPVDHDLKRVLLDQLRSRRGVDQRTGAPASVQLRIRTPAKEAINTRRFDMQTIAIGHIPRMREGTR